MDPALIGFGLGVGMLVGMTGIGGGSLMTPLLILLFGVNPITAVGTDLAYAAVTKTVGGYKHWIQKTVDFKLSAWMAFGSVPAALGGVYVLDVLEDSYGSDFDDLLLTLLAAALLLCGVATLARALMKRFHARERSEIPMDRRHKIAAVSLGVFVGFVLGITSAGSGALIAVGLILMFRLVPTRVVGTDVFHAAILLWAAAAAHLASGNVDFALAGTMLIGSVPGVWLGSHWSVRVPQEILRGTLAVVLIGAGMALLAKAGLGIPKLALVPFPLAVVVLLVVTMVRDYRLRQNGPVRPAAAAPPDLSGRGAPRPPPPCPRRSPVSRARTRRPPSRPLDALSRGRAAARPAPPGRRSAADRAGGARRSGGSCPLSLTPGTKASSLSTSVPPPPMR